MRSKPLTLQPIRPALGIPPPGPQPQVVPTERSDEGPPTYPSSVGDPSAWTPATSRPDRAKRRGTPNLSVQRRGSLRLDPLRVPLLSTPGDRDDVVGGPQTPNPKLQTPNPQTPNSKPPNSNPHLPLNSRISTPACTINPAGRMSRDGRSPARSPIHPVA
jgi:hypothetical protein